MPCGETVSLSSLADPCPRCGSHQLQVTGGNELKVKEVEIH
jgi:hydrogenase nickel incorporation protein HypA/HybF